jgi:pullulanase/glycogen debranching enzyme
MPIKADILERKRTHFVLWGPNVSTTAPTLVIGQLQSGNPPTFVATKRVPLGTVSGKPGLWVVAAAACQLQEGQVYHYWFEVEDTTANSQPRPKIVCTDPLAYVVDWRLFPPSATNTMQPAAVIKFEGGNLVPADPGGEVGRFDQEPTQNTLPTNNHLVIYELPTAWSVSRTINGVERDVGTFQDVRALIDKSVAGANFAELSLLDKNNSYLTDLGINALELLPPADSFFKREWGYDTAHFLAPDFELGFPDGNASPTANRDLTNLVQACHQNGIRFFIDVVMAFSREEAYQHIDRPDFYIDDPGHHQDDPDAKTSGRDGDGHLEVRNGFGSVLFRYSTPTSKPVYDPLSGDVAPVYPARLMMFTYLTRWMRDFHVDGIRMDSVENVANWDFVGGFKDLARKLWNQRWLDANQGPGADDRFLVVGEELSLPMELLRQQRLDGLWNDSFQQLVRAAILGQSGGGESSFEWTVRKAIDCRNIGFADGAQAINYVTKHDVEGFRHERLFTMLRGFGNEDKEKRIKLAFVCLLTAVGIPMFLAGEEFADQHDFFDQNGNVTQDGGKQVDPVNFGRLVDTTDPLQPMRKRIFEYVARLVAFRTHQPALGVNDTEFIHLDFDFGKRILVWRRGGPGQDPVVVVANFSDFVTAGAGSPSAEYRVPNWPATPAGRQWREVTQSRIVLPEWVGREPFYPWEAKVYTLQ